MYGPRAPLGILQSVFRLQKRSARIILDADMRANSDAPFTRLDCLTLHLEVKVNIFVQVHKRINVRSLGYMSDLLVSNSDINERNNRNDSLNLVCPRFKREIDRVGGGAFIWCEGNKIVECSVKFFKED